MTMSVSLTMPNVELSILDPSLAAGMGPDCIESSVPEIKLDWILNSNPPEQTGG